jgi:hypothetical protein
MQNASNKGSWFLSRRGAAVKNLVLLMFVSLITGCSTNELAKELNSRGAGPSTIRKLIFQDSEGGYGSNVSVTVTDKDVIRKIWRSIKRAKPYGRYSFCGVQKIKFYSRKDSTTPLAVLNLYCGDIKSWDSTHLEGIEPGPFENSRGGRAGLYQCEGLHELVMEHLKDEYERRQRISERDD